MANKLYLHPVTETALQPILKKLPQGLLLSGPRGLGLGSLSQLLAKSAVSAPAQRIIPDEKNTIGIDNIRQLYQQTRTKQGEQVIIIKDADRMTTEAQNAFLKLLEEPNSGLHFILTSHLANKLLPTILSRVQHIAAKPLTKQQTEQFLDKLQVTDPAQRAQLLFIASGLPAELERLVASPQYFSSKAQAVRDARQLLQSSAYEKLLLINKYTDREKALTLLGTAMQILQLTIHKNPQLAIVEQLEKLLLAEARIRENGHVRTQLLRAVS